MKVILKESITGLGSPGDLVNVKSGYGRNFLMPTGKAIPATEENLKVYEAEKTKLAELENKKIKEAKEIESKLSGFNLEIKVALSGGRPSLLMKPPGILPAAYSFSS